MTTVLTRSFPLRPIAHTKVKQLYTHYILEQLEGQSESSADMLILV